MHLTKYKLFPSDVKLLYPLKIKLNPIQNFIISRVSISSRKQNPLDIPWIKRGFCCNCHSFVQIILMKNTA